MYTCEPEVGEAAEIRGAGGPALQQGEPAGRDSVSGCSGERNAGSSPFLSSRPRTDSSFVTLTQSHTGKELSWV